VRITVFVFVHRDALRLDKAMPKFEGGETKALQRVNYYLWESKLVSNYFDIRNGMLGGDYSTKLSVWLAHGCISPGYIWQEIGRYEKQRGNNKSTYW
jgi:deoxyribodipyrimidine photo-lyase